MRREYSAAICGTCSFSANEVQCDLGPLGSAASANFSWKTLYSSPAIFGAMVADPRTGYVYAADNGSKLYCYKPLLNKWETLPSRSFGGQVGEAVLIGDNIYTAFETVSSVLGVYNISSRTWSTIPKGNSFDSGNACTDGTYLYRFWAGYVQRFSPQTQSWEDLPSSPGAIDTSGVSAYLDGYIYCTGGVTRTTFYRYRIATRTWEKLPPSPVSCTDGGAMDTIGRKFYVTARTGGARLYRYDVDSRRWDSVALPMSGNSGGTMAFDPNSPGRIYVRPMDTRSTWFYLDLPYATRVHVRARALSARGSTISSTR
jgi:hypothetical protein